MKLTDSVLVFVLAAVSSTSVFVTQDDSAWSSTPPAPPEEAVRMLRA